MSLQDDHDPRVEKEVELIIENYGKRPGSIQKGYVDRNIDAQIGETRILSNQLGYVAHNEHLSNGFVSGRVIEL